MGPENALVSELQADYVIETVHQMTERPIPTEYESLVTNLFTSASAVASRLNERQPNPSQKRTGGVMVIARVGENPFMAVQKIGAVQGGNPDAPHLLDQYKLDKYTWFAYSKARLLIENPNLLATSQNLDSLAPNYPAILPGGAVRFGDLIIGFSGYNAEDDESLVLATAELAQLEWPGDTLNLAQQLGNQRYVKDLYWPLLQQEPRLSQQELRQYRENRRYGDSHLANELFYELLAQKDYLGLAIALGWSEGCDVIPRVIQGRGAKETAQAYAELSLMRGILLDSVRQHYPQITPAFIRPVRRREGEPNTGGYPNMHDETTSLVPANEKLLSYDFPRLFRAFWGEGERSKRDPARFFLGLDLVEEALQHAKAQGFTPTEFIVDLAEMFTLHDHDPQRYLRRLLSAGKYRDDNQHSAHRQLVRTMKSLKTSLWSTYQDMSGEERQRRSLADITL